MSDQMLRECLLRRLNTWTDRARFLRKWGLNSEADTLEDCISDLAVDLGLASRIFFSYITRAELLNQRKEAA